MGGMEKGVLEKKVSERLEAKMRAGRKAIFPATSRSGEVRRLSLERSELNILIFKM